MTTKDTLLVLLCKNRGFFISGEYVAHELGITRTAVWKAIKKLQDEGYDITAVTNRGYCLSKETDLLYSQGISEFLDEDIASKVRTEVFVSVDSTADKCIEKAKQGEEEGYVAVSCSQPHVRGPRSRIFYAPADSGIYMSIYLKPEGKNIDDVMSMASDALCKSIKSVCGKDAKSDDNALYVSGKRVGILTSDTYEDALIVNMGVNIFPPLHGFPDNPNYHKAGAIMKKSDKPVRNKLVAQILNNFFKAYTE